MTEKEARVKRVSRLTGVVLSALLVANPAFTANNPAHYRGKMTIEGPWSITETAAKEKYQVPLARFGTFQILKPDGEAFMDGSGKKPAVLRELHYRLCSDVSTLGTNWGLRNAERCNDDNFKGYGVRPVPVVNGKYDSDDQAPKVEVGIKGGEEGATKEIVGSEVLDEYLRKVTYPKRDAEDTANLPIYSVIAYQHPENPVAGFQELGNMDLLKTENSITHLGLYIGNGQTRNSPTNYHSWTWGHKGYPPLAFIVQYRGAEKQEDFNRNATLAIQMLNELNDGPAFPGDYKFDWFRSINLEETLAFYRAWIDTSWVREGYGDGGTPFFDILKNTDLFQTYCAEHVTVALNVALNVPQNEAGYIRIWGEEEGKKLWALAKKRWKEERKTDKPIVAEGEMPETPASFKPLYLINGESSARTITPTAITTVGKHMAWAPETSADLMRDFLEQYANWTVISPVLTTATILGFVPELNRRTGIDMAEIQNLAKPVLESMYVNFAAFMLSKELDKNEDLVAMRDASDDNGANGPEENSGLLSGLRSRIGGFISQTVVAIKKFGTEHLKLIQGQLEKNKAYETVLQKYTEGVDQLMGAMEEKVKAGLAQIQPKMDAAMEQFKTQMTAANPDYAGRQPELILEDMRKAAAEGNRQLVQLFEAYDQAQAALAGVKANKTYVATILSDISKDEIKTRVYDQAVQLFKNPDQNTRLDWAYSIYKKEAYGLLKEARKKPISIQFDEQLQIWKEEGSVDKKVQFYSPPAIVLRAAHGIHETNNSVRLIPVATVMDAAETEFIGEGNYVECDPTVAKLGEGADEAANRAACELKTR
jgi:hypothetical protein